MNDTTLRAGWARADITPPPGTRLRGYFSERLADGVHDPLLAKALYLEEGDEQALFIACDLCTVDRHMTAGIRERVAAASGLAPERVIVNATHTHLGPFSNEQAEFLAERAAQAGLWAIANAGPVEAEWGTGHEGGVAFCRRFHMKDGTVRTNPGVLNPDIVRPTAPIDPEVGVLVLHQPESGRRLVVWNYALHLDTIGGCTCSADYPYFVEQFVRRAWDVDGEVDCLFVQGCCGDINHTDVSGASRTKGFAKAEEIGTILGAEILKVLAKYTAPVSLSPLAFDHEVLSFDIHMPSDEELAAAERTFDTNERGLNVETFIKARNALARRRLETPYVIEVGAIRAGDVSLAAFPGEMFCAFGRQLKADAPTERLLIAELAYTDAFYIPTEEQWPLGGYEPYNSILPVGAGEQIVATAQTLLNRLADRPAAAPQPAAPA